MKNEFMLAFNEVIEEKQLPREIILSALEAAMVSAYRKAVTASASQLIEAKVNPETGQVIIMAEKEVVDSIHDDRTEVLLEEARKYNPEAEYGDLVIVETTPGDFGRVAAQTARQVIQQKIRDAERQAQLDFYGKQAGEIVSGVVQAINSLGLTIGLELRAEGIMSRKDMIPGERFRIHDRVRSLIAEVKDTQRGPQIVLSRTHRDFLRRLLENEVPEIYHGVVEIRSIAREPGQRAKVAVSATQSGIDPVGACVGLRGVRIQTIVRELHDEKIDVIEWNSDPAAFIAKALSPAKVSGVYLQADHLSASKTATVVVMEDQLSLAIGRDGQNARLAAKLTGWRIDIKSLTEATSDALHKLQQDPEYSEIANSEGEMIEQIAEMLAKKADNRILTPEEYDAMSKFVDRVEKQRFARMPKTITEIVAPEFVDMRNALPKSIVGQNILDSGLPEHIAYILQEAGIANTDELYLQIKNDPDVVLKLQGIGPKSMNEITGLVESIETMVAEGEQPEAAEEEPATAEAETETAVDVAETEAPLGEVELTDVLEAAAPDGVAEAATTSESDEQAAEGAEEEFGEETSLEEIFTLKPEMLTVATTEEDEEDTARTKGGKKKKKKHVEVEYDPDRDVTVVHRKHKRDGLGWSEWE
ncbi:MAG: transcription termination/antitermination protein NusA [Anaerolineae bacterium]|nr:transcription termination/antitermination protein NusA [Anaerolineae bacterium]